MKLILASNSPRRRQLLASSGWAFTALAAEVDENPLPGEKPLRYVLRLAENKARAVASQASPGATVLAADTTVVDCRAVDGALQEVILGKPVDPADAEEMLQRLRGRTHQVYTGMVVLQSAGESLFADWCVTSVLMRNYSDQEIREYIGSGDPLDKAGAYAIQHSGFHPVVNLQGCYANVVGLPICHVTRLLERVGKTPNDAQGEASRLTCRSPLPHNCQIDRQVVEGM